MTGWPALTYFDSYTPRSVDICGTEDGDIMEIPWGYEELGLQYKGPTKVLRFPHRLDSIPPFTKIEIETVEGYDLAIKGMTIARVGYSKLRRSWYVEA